FGASILPRICMCTRDCLAKFSVLTIFFATSAFGALPGWWYTLTSPTNSSLTAAAYGAGQWVIVGRGSTILTSQNGFLWKQVPNSFGSGSDFLSVTYGNGMFIAGGSLNVLRCSSPDGTNWTIQASTTGTE